MKLRDQIRTAIKDAVKNYDFEDYISRALDEINIEQIIENKLEARLEYVDFEQIVEGTIDDIFDDEFDAYELQEIITESLED